MEHTHLPNSHIAVYSKWGVKKKQIIIICTLAQLHTTSFGLMIKGVGKHNGHESERPTAVRNILLQLDYVGKKIAVRDDEPTGINTPKLACIDWWSCLLSHLDGFASDRTRSFEFKRRQFSVSLQFPAFFCHYSWYTLTVLVVLQWVIFKQNMTIPKKKILYIKMYQ